jgi:long-chain acyl-CoA synthetase
MAVLSDSDLLLQRFWHHVHTRPDAVWITQPFEGGQTVDYTWAQVADRAKRMAAHLRSLELPPQSKIAMISKNCAHFFIAELAVWMAGHATVAIYPTLDEATVRYILEHSEAKLVFVGKLDEWDNMKGGVPEGLPHIAFPLAPPTDFPTFDEIVSKTEPIEDEPVRDADDIALMIYTSGSTGTPKGVLHSFATLSGPTVGISKLLDFSPEDRILSYLPLAHGMDRWLSFCCTMYSGVHVYFAESLATFVQDLNRARPTLFLSVPRLWLKFQLGVYKKMPPKKLNFLLKIPILSGIIKKKILTGLGLDQVRFAGSGSAPISAELLAFYRGLGLELLEGYGMSENFNYSHLTMPGRGRPGYIGHPYNDVECKLSESGEILVKSPGNMVGYYKAPELTAEAFTEDGFLRTGDQGEMDEEGRLRITGRVKEIFKTSKGKYVAPAPIENLINDDPNVELSLVGGSGMPMTHAVLQVAEDLQSKLSDPEVRARLEAEFEALLAKVNGQVVNFERLGFLVVAKDRWTIADGHLTPTMKIRRPILEKQYEPKHEAWYAAGKKVIWED